MKAVKRKVGKYELGRTIGEGTFAKVKFAQNMETNETVAIKVMAKSTILRHKMVDQIKREISIMKIVRHPCIVRLHEVLAGQTKIYIVLELVSGGELFDKIVHQGRLSESESRTYFQQLIDAISHCHGKGVYHRDLKPENLLLDSRANLKVSDFGLSALPKQGVELLHTTCGTPNYVAPEVLSDQGYDGAAADLWSCGVILYVLMAGYLPFEETDLPSLYSKINAAQFSCPYWFSPAATSLIHKILDPNPVTELDSFSALVSNFCLPFEIVGLRTGMFNNSDLEDRRRQSGSLELDTPNSKYNEGVEKTLQIYVGEFGNPKNVHLACPLVGDQDNEKQRIGPHDATPPIKIQSSIFYRIKIEGIKRDQWFKKNYVPVTPRADEVVNLDDVSVVFGDIQDRFVNEESQNSDDGPLVMNAFEMITLSQGLNLSALFDRRQDYVKRQTRFVSRQPAKAIISAIEAVAQSVGLKVHTRNYKTRLEGLSANRVSQFAVVLEVFEVAPSLFMVDVRKVAGDTLEYHKFYKHLCERIDHIIWRPKVSMPSSILF